MNKERWCNAVSVSSPCGEDLEYDADFMALARAALGAPEQQYGHTVIPAEKPDWREVERVAENLLDRSKDLRVGVLLTRAITQNHGLSGLAAGLDMIRFFLERYWDDVHPQMMVDGDDDPFVRINAIAELADLTGLIRDIRQTVLIKSPLGQILVKDAEAALEQGQAETGVTRMQLLAMSADAHSQSQSSLLAVEKAHQTITFIHELCKEQFGSEQSPDLSSLMALLSRLMVLIPGHSLMGDEAPEDQQRDINEPGQDHDQFRKSGSLTEMRSRQDVLRALDAACRYLQENEPTNPAPLLIKRAQRLMRLDFMDIMRDLAPDSMNHIELITGVQQP